jgi:hypothetical protein
MIFKKFIIIILLTGIFLLGNGVIGMEHLNHSETEKLSK